MAKRSRGTAAEAALTPRQREWRRHLRLRDDGSHLARVDRLRRGRAEPPVMMRITEDIQVYLCCEPVEMRKAINGLAILVEETLALDPFAPALFVFCSKKRDRIKS